MYVGHMRLDMSQSLKVEQMEEFGARTCCSILYSFLFLEEEEEEEEAALGGHNTSIISSC